MRPTPELAYLVCATQRSGSTVLCETLRATGVAGQPLEHFEHLRHSGRPRQGHEYLAGVDDHALEGLLPPPAPVRDEGDESPSAWWSRIVREGSSANGVWGGKLMWDHVDDFTARAGQLDGVGAGAGLAEVLDRLFGELRLVYVRREDTVAQAISFWRAIQTQAWRHDPDAKHAPPAYHYGAIDHLVTLLEQHDAAWQRWFADGGREPLTLVYEQLRDDVSGAVGEIVRSLGLTVGELPAPALSRQRDGTSREWAQRFREERAARTAEVVADGALAAEAAGARGAEAEAGGAREGAVA
ncbi:Stf0 family sulfotransferase [Conexibacter stalactiti]|uniref:Trehalose 2-sulfotransferase n=1 Tax=Conexibacter stalactiti TaxID=1940611 RepID=A0ABU4HLT6_9ACTN|nr:Stf0 family sulfotransferase [Conexibacter stalactiti]MDW5594266.1 Stf0 family sulfotransferase [Conexibacter stalactiti]MEC5034908.1 Stf0 family sulfotransferase [Conexibacter stalactiti]